MNGADLPMFGNTHQRSPEPLRRFGPRLPACVEHRSAIAAGLDFQEWLVLRRGYAALAEAQRPAKAPENHEFGPLPSGIRGSRATAWQRARLHALERAADGGAHTFDFLRSGEPYNYRFAARDRCERTWLVPRGPAGTLLTRGCGIACIGPAPRRSGADEG
jgi:hypothetical protein